LNLRNDSRHLGQFTVGLLTDITTCRTAVLPTWRRLRVDTVIWSDH